MDFTIENSCSQCESKFMNAKAVLDNEESAIFTCDEGHKIKAFIGIPRFSLYFDKSIQALINEFYYEAYSWAYTALEMFRKDFLKAYLSIYNHIDIQEIDNTFNKRFKYSENIYGAYAFAYLSYFKHGPDDKKSPYPITQNQEVKRRNDMFHQGILPSSSAIEEDIYKIYCHMLYGYQNFKDTSGKHSFFAIMEYYGNRYVNWEKTENITEKEKSERKTILHGSDLGAFSFNSHIEINKDGSGNFPTLEQLKSRVIFTRDIIERNRNA